jgi:hypothetical protein
MRRWLGILLLVFACGCPLPTPKVPPVPPVPPAPAKASSLFLVVVDDSENPTFARAQFLGDLKYWQGLRGRGHDWRKLDASEVKDPASDAHKYDDDVAAAGGAPCVIVLDKTPGPSGKLNKLDGEKLPETVSDMDKLIGKYSDK